MGRKKAGGFIFEWYSGDHEPFHVHVFEGSVFIGRFDVAHQKAMGQWILTNRLRKALKQAGFLFQGKNKK